MKKKILNFVLIMGISLVMMGGVLFNHFQPAKADNVEEFILEKTSIHPKTGEKIIHKVKYDDHGNPLEKKYYTLDGDGVENEDGIANTLWKYDDHENKIEERSFDLEGDLAEDASGVWVYRWIYDDDGNLTEEQYLSGNGKTLESSYEGYAVIRFRYDEAGYRIEESYFDETNSPFAKDDGVFMVRYEYDDAGNKITEARYGIDKTFVEDENGIALRRYLYDENACLTEEQFFGEDEQRKEDAYGIAVIQHRCDETGNDIEETYLTAAQEPTEDIYGVSMIRHQYDAEGREVERRYFDSKGDLTEYGDGTVLRQYVYDPDGSFHTKTLSKDRKVTFLTEEVDRYVKELIQVIDAVTEETDHFVSGVKAKKGNSESLIFRLLAHEMDETLDTFQTRLEKVLPFFENSIPHEGGFDLFEPVQLEQQSIENLIQSLRALKDMPKETDPKFFYDHVKLFRKGWKGHERAVAQITNFVDQYNAALESDSHQVFSFIWKIGLIFMAAALFIFFDRRRDTRD